MPRSCGCSGRCSCVIVGGSGVTVTGIGTAENKYVIEMDSGGGGGGGGFDTGDVKWTARPSAPAGWLLCDGAPVSRSAYSALFAAIGTLYGPGDGTTTFNVPDYTGRFILGADADHPQGSSGGTNQVAIGVANLPAHSHSINHDHGAATTSSAGAHDHATSSSVDDTITDSGHFRRAGTSGSVANRNLIINDGSGAHTHTVDLPNYVGTSGQTGSGIPLSILPAYGTALPLIKT